MMKDQLFFERCYSAVLPRLVFTFATIGALAGSVLFGQAPDPVWYPIGPPGGEAAYIEADHQNPGTLYAVNTIAGVFKSNDSGDQWFKVNSGLAPGHHYFGPLVIDPFDPRTLYLGTSNTDFLGGSGVYRTTDGGETWTNIGPDPIRVGQIVTDPGRAGVVYVWGSRRYSMNSQLNSLDRTVDAGKTWESIALPYWYIGPPLSLQLAVDSGDPNILYLAHLGLGGQPSTFYISRSGGASWSELQLPVFKIGTLRTSSRQSGVVLLTSSAGLYRSTDNGTQWARITALAEEEVTGLVENPRTGALYVRQNGIWVSRDLGATWTRLTTEGPPELKVVEPDPFNDQTLYAGTETGIFKSTDEGATWQQPPLNGYNTRSVAQVFPHPKVPGRVYAMVQPTSTRWVVCSECPLSKTDDYGAHWKSLSLSDVRAVRFNPADSSLVYAWTAQGVWISRDAGNTWSAANTGLPASLPSRGDLQVDPRNPTHLYLALGAVADTPPALYRSADGGASWEKVGPIPVSMTGAGLSLGIPPVSPQILLVASSSSSVRSLDGGLTWETIEPSGNTVLIAPSDTRIIYIGAYRSDDGGEHWRRIARAPSSVDWFDPMLVYYGPFRSRDGGASWDYYGQGADSVFIMTIADPHEPGAAYAGILGYGAYRRIAPSAVSLYFPYLAEDTTSAFTGFAVGNQLDTANRVNFTAYSPSGELLALKENPTSNLLEGDQQLAKLGRALFAEEEVESVQGWIAAKSEADTGGFFLFARGGQADGALAETGASSDLYFSRVLQGSGAFLGQDVKTTIVLANPEGQPGAVSLVLRAEDGTTVRTVERTVPARGRFEESAASLFGNAPIQSGYIVVTGSPVVGFEFVEFPKTSTTFGLNALRKISLGSAWSAQLANVPGMKTRVRLINTSWDKPIKAVLKAVDDSGQPLAPPVEVEIPKNGAFERDIAELFKFESAKPAIGSLTVTADSSGLVGDVVFGDLETFRLAAALPLQTEGFREALFSQVANGMGYYNGLALYNPNAGLNEVVITVRNAEGEVTGEKTLKMPPGTRLAELLPDIVPSTAGQIRGTIRITSSLPLVAQELFGTDDFLAAVPAWPIVR